MTRAQEPHPAPNVPLIEIASISYTPAKADSISIEKPCGAGKGYIFSP